MGFTSIHPDIIRATGLLSAIAGTRIGAQRYLKSIANIRLALLLGTPYTFFAVAGAISACISQSTLDTMARLFLKLRWDLLSYALACFIFS